MAFNFNKFTIKTQELIQTAIEIAQNYNNQVLEPVHLLAAIVQEQGNIADTIIQKTGGNISLLKIKINEELNTLPQITGAGLSNQSMSPNTIKVFDDATEEARNMKDEFVSSEHLVIALAKSPDKAGRLLNDMGITKDNVLFAIKD